MQAPTTLTYSVVHDSPVQVQPIVVMREVSIYFLQQQVHTLWAEYWEVRVLLWGGHVPPHSSDLYWCPPWGLSVLVPICLFPLLVLF